MVARRRGGEAPRGIKEEPPSVSNVTSERLAELRSICAGATPGPWTFEPPIAPAGAVDIQGPPKGDGYEDAVAEWISECEDGGMNASFIATARVALPEALDEIDRLRDELINAKSALTQPELHWECQQKIDALEQRVLELGREAVGLEADVAAADARLVGVIDGTFAIGDGTAQREIERLRAEVELARPAYEMARAARTAPTNREREACLAELWKCVDAALAAEATEANGRS
jgi:hypothetical protein